MKRITPAFLVALLAAGCAAATASPVLKTSTPAPTVAARTTPIPTSNTAPKPTQAASSVKVEGSALFISYLYDHTELHRLDLATGDLAAPTRPLDMGEFPVFALSDDGSRMALFNYPDSYAPSEGTLQLVDLRTLESITAKGVSFPATVNMLIFSPDSSRLAATYFITENGSPDSPISEFHLALIDLTKSTVVADVDLGYSPNLLRWSPDGTSIAVYGIRYGSYEKPDPQTPQVALLDGADLHTLWSAKIDGLRDGGYPDEDAAPDSFFATILWTPAADFSADASHLYIVHADEDKLTTVDFTRKAISTVGIGAKVSFLDRLMGFGAGVAHAKAVKGTTLSGVISADGSQMLVVGTHMDYTVVKGNKVNFTNTPLDLRVIDVASGALLHTVSTHGTRLDLSPDGSRLFIGGYSNETDLPFTKIIDTSTFEIIATVPGWEVYAQPLDLNDGLKAHPAMRWNFNGDTSIALIDAATFEPIISWDSSESSAWLVIRH